MVKGSGIPVISFCENNSGQFLTVLLQPYVLVYYFNNIL